MSEPNHRIPWHQKISLWLYDWAGALIIVVIFALLMGAKVYYSLKGAHHHDGYLSADVLFTFDVGKHDRGANVRLADGTIGTVVAGSTAESGRLRNSVCLERRMHDSGEFSYEIAPPNKCPTE